ncbi:MAG: carbohydrate-binding domain-containing protein [Lachnospiraceae bacterium]|nr:carbohydrate-binding domain-containing protein [Lachnospiraceae bacterium]
MKRRLTLLFVLLAVLALTGCTEQEEKKITFSDTGIRSDVIGVATEGTTLTIKVAGTYILTGSCNEGNIIVDAPGGKPVTLVFDGLKLTSSTVSPIYVKNCPMVILEIREKTQNIIADHRPAPEENEDENAAESTATTLPVAAIESKSPLLIRGQSEGQLVVDAACRNGITSNDTLTIEGGVVNVTAKNHALRGRDYVLISGGVITLKADNDGIRATNIDRPSLGYVLIKGGVINITADDEGIYAPRSINFEDGTISIKSKNNGIKAGIKDENGLLSGGTVNFNAGIITVTANDNAVIAADQNRRDEALVTLNGKVME